VLIPGEPEQHCLAERERNGVPVADEVWQEMVVWANRGGIDLSLYPPRLP